MSHEKSDVENEGPKTCNHVPNLHKMTLAPGYMPVIWEGRRIDFVVDIPCTRCGRLGASSVRVDLEDIQW